MNDKEILIAALKTVEDARIPEVLRPAAFSKAVDLIVNQSNLSSRKYINQVSVDNSTEPSDGGIESIAAKLKLPIETVADIYDIVDNELQIHVMTSKLVSSKKGGTQQLALLAVAGRQASGLDERYTDVKDIRPYCEDYKKFDSPNFSKTIKGMEYEFNITSGKGNKRFVKMSNPGWEKASELIKQLTSDSEQ